MGVIAGTLFATERKNVLQQSRSLSHPLSELTSWITEHPQDIEAQIALLARVHYHQTHCRSDCDQWAKKSRYYANLWDKGAPKIATGWLLTAQIAKANGQMNTAQKRIDQALALHPGMPQAWKFKLATFSHDPNYASWYNEAAQWLHGTYQLKGFPKP